MMFGRVYAKINLYNDCYTTVHRKIHFKIESPFSFFVEKKIHKMVVGVPPTPLNYIRSKKLIK